MSRRWSWSHCRSRGQLFVRRSRGRGAAPLPSNSTRPRTRHHDGGPQEESPTLPSCTLRSRYSPNHRGARCDWRTGRPRADSRRGAWPSRRRIRKHTTRSMRRPVSLASREVPRRHARFLRGGARPCSPAASQRSILGAPLLLRTTARYCELRGGPSQMSFSVILTEKGGPTQRLDFECEEITIGRVDENDICLPKGNISKKHTRIVVKDGKIIVLDLRSTNGTYVNGRKLAGPQLISPADKVYIGDFILNVEPPDLELPQDGAPADGTPVAEEPTMTPALPHSAAGEATRREPHLRPGTSTPAPQPCAPPASHGQTLQLVHGRLIEALDLRRLDLDALGSDELWQKAEASVRQIVSRMDQTGELGPHLDRDELIEDVLNEALGLGPLETWLADDSVSEIMVNSPTQV